MRPLLSSRSVICLLMCQSLVLRPTLPPLPLLRAFIFLSACPVPPCFLHRRQNYKCCSEALGPGGTPPSLSSTSSYWQTRQSSLLLYNFRIKSSELCRDKPAHEGSFEYLSFVPSIILPVSRNPNSPKDDWVVIVAVTLNVSLCLAPGWIIDG